MQRGEQEPVYSISIAAHLLNVTPRQLRTYEEAGLIRPHRTAGNTRLYSEQDMKKLAVVCYLHQKKEVNLQGIKIIMSLISAVSAKEGNYEPEEKCREAERELWEKIREIAPHFLK